MNTEMHINIEQSHKEENIDEHATEKIAKFILENIGIKEN